MDYSFHWKPVLRSLPQMLDAALLSLEVSVLSMLVGIVLGLALAMANMNGSVPYRSLAQGWIGIARNTPALFQLFFFGFGLGAVGINLSPYLIVLLALSFNNAGYLAEIFRGGIESVPETQLRAARLLGMTPVQSYLRIVFPQVFRIVYHPMTNQFVWAVLMSSLGMLVGFRELSGEAQFLASKTFRIFEYFAVAALIYYALVKLILAISSAAAWRVFRWSR